MDYVRWLCLPRKPIIDTWQGLKYSYANCHNSTIKQVEWHSVKVGTMLFWVILVTAYLKL